MSFEPSDITEVTATLNALSANAWIAGKGRLSNRKSLGVFMPGGIARELQTRKKKVVAPPKNTDGRVSMLRQVGNGW